MFDLPVMIIITLVMAIIHVALWHMLPKKLKHILLSNPVLAFLVDLAGSSLITIFTGVASFVGVCNLMASVLFGIFAVIYAKKLGIKGLGIGSYKLFNCIPILPRLVVCYQVGDKCWRE